MISTTFETKRFRVQITGKTVWVESKEGAAWIFRNQHQLPIPAAALHGRSEATVLRAAVQHYERANNGDQSLREALTGIKEEQKPMNPAPAASAPAKPYRLPRRIAPAAQAFRQALRPPLKLDPRTAQ
jgi:hypothetical protein